MANSTQVPAQQPIFAGVNRFLNYLLQPRSTNRDEAFREGTIRITITIMFVLSLLGLLTTVFIFRDEWTLLTFQTFESIAIVLCIMAAIAVSQQRIFLAGGFVVSIFIFAAGGIQASPGSASSLNIGVSVFMVAIIGAALLLPRYTIVPLGMFCIVLSALIWQYKQVPVATLQSQVASGLFLFLVELLFLRQLRVEFDNRLAAMRQSLKEIEEAREREVLARNQAEEARAEAEKANKAKSQFLANMSHELRTPLNAIIGYTEIMLSGMAGNFTEKQTKLQEYIHVNAKRLLGLINDVLDLAKIEAGKIEIVLAPENPRRLINDVIDSMQSLAQQKNIYLRTQYDDSTPEALLCDSKKVQQIVTNLVGNALKFTNEGGVEVLVNSPTPESWQIKVTDTGRGMPPDAVTYIFESFRQVDASDARDAKGTGLGLAITNLLVERMNGKIALQTELGKGSTFAVTLPRAENALSNR